MTQVAYKCTLYEPLFIRLFVSMFKSKISVSYINRRRLNCKFFFFNTAQFFLVCETNNRIIKRQFHCLFWIFMKPNEDPKVVIIKRVGKHHSVTKRSMDEQHELNLKIKSLGAKYSYVSQELNILFAGDLNCKALLDVAEKVKQYIQIPIDRLTRRHKSAMICWYAEHWEQIKPIVIHIINTKNSGVDNETKNLKQSLGNFSINQIPATHSLSSFPTTNVSEVITLPNPIHEIPPLICPTKDLAVNTPQSLENEKKPDAPSKKQKIRLPSILKFTNPDQ